MSELVASGSWRVRLAALLEARVPAHLRAAQRPGDERRRGDLERALRGYCSQGRPPSFLDTAPGREDLHQHLSGRLESFRSGVVPWLDDARPLASTRVLEIGCGTGSSTVALAEQGARVTAIDTDPSGLEIARERCRTHGVEATFHEANATSVAELFARGDFDLVIFFASLEHMTHDERLQAMNAAWRLLEVGGLWCIAHAPNRLWFHDDHTSRLPFFMWLPDELAFDYSRFSPREGFREVYRRRDEESLLHFVRRGRGVSFHEFDLAIAPVDELEVVSSLAAFKNRNPVRRALRRWTREHRYRRFLARRSGRCVDPAFFQPYLYLILRKG